MQAQGLVGPAVQADGNQPNLRQGRLAELFTSESVGKYYELAKRGLLYTSAMQAAASLGTALTAAAVTLTLYNPLGSTVDLVMLQCAVQITAVGTVANVIDVVYAGSLGMSTNVAPTAVTAAKVYPARLTMGATGGVAGGVGQCWTAATLGATAPVVVRPYPLMGNVVATAANNINLTTSIDYIDGALVLGPGVAVTIQAIATAAPTGLVGYVWAEIPN